MEVKIPKNYVKRVKRKEIPSPKPLNPSTYNPKQSSNPILSTVFKDNIYKNITYFKNGRSRFYWVRVRYEGKYFVKSLETENKKDCNELGKKFFESLIQKPQLISKSPNSKTRFNKVCLDVVDYFKQYTPKQLSNFNGIIKNTLLPFFKNKDIKQIDYIELVKFVEWLDKGLVGRSKFVDEKNNKFGKTLEKDKISHSTKKHYIICLKHIFKFCLRKGYIQSLPTFPTIKKVDDDRLKRGYFNYGEWRSFDIFVSKQLNKPHKTKDKRVSYVKYPINRETQLLFQFLLYSGIRVSDIKVLRWKDVEVKEDLDRKKQKLKDYRYLKLTHPKTKTVYSPITTLYKCFDITEELKEFRRNNKINNKTYLNKTDFVFLPHLNEEEFPKNKDIRRFSINVFSSQFKFLVDKWKDEIVSKHKKYKDSENLDKLVLYSLRHTYVMMRLKFGDNINIFTLSKNLRSSVEMVERFYGKYFESDVETKNLLSYKKEKKEYMEEVGGIVD